MRALVVLLLPLLLVLGTSCRSTTAPGTLFSSAPPGARVVVDGEDSGWVTPCMVELDRSASHEVRLSLPGYRDEHIAVHPEERVEVVSWMDGISSTDGFALMLFLPLRALVQPVRLDQSSSPGRIFIRLRPRGNG